MAWTSLPSACTLLHHPRTLVAVALARWNSREHEDTTDCCHFQELVDFNTSQLISHEMLAASDFRCKIERRRRLRVNQRCPKRSAFHACSDPVPCNVRTSSIIPHLLHSRGVEVIQKTTMASSTAHKLALGSHADVMRLDGCTPSHQLIGSAVVHFMTTPGYNCTGEC